MIHPSHVTRISLDASSFDEVCINCGATDRGRDLEKPCSNPHGNDDDKEST